MLAGRGLPAPAAPASLARDRAGARRAGRHPGDDDPAGLPGLPRVARAGQRLPVGAVPGDRVPVRGQGPGVRRQAARRDAGRGGAAAPAAGRADALGRAAHAAGQGRLRRGHRGVPAAGAGRGQPGPGRVRAALGRGRGAGRARLDVGALAVPARADGRAADRPEIGHRRVDRRAVPARADRASLLPELWDLRSAL
jgi:hypothetical protein